MTLKEKFKKIDIILSKNHTTKIVDREAIIMVKIADDYAIEFVEWILCNQDMEFEYEYNNHTDGLKKLLEIFKKEKGL